MILQAAIIGVGAATLLLVAGYLFGVQRGYGAREHLRRQSAQQAVEMERLHALLMRGEQADTRRPDPENGDGKNGSEDGKDENGTGKDD